MCLSQKELELATVRASLEKLKICSDPALVEDEPPDVEFLNDGMRFGVEVTHYHQSRLIRGKFPRRQIEMHWEDFREFAFDYLNDSYPELLRYNVLLQFRDLNVPKKEDWESFVDEVAGLLEQKHQFCWNRTDRDTDLERRAFALQTPSCPLCIEVGSNWTMGF